jgi:hypothetical protein
MAARMLGEHPGQPQPAELPRAQARAGRSSAAQGRGTASSSSQRAAQGDHHRRSRRRAGSSRPVAAQAQGSVRCKSPHGHCSPDGRRRTGRRGHEGLDPTPAGSGAGGADEHQAATGRRSSARQGRSHDQVGPPADHLEYAAPVRPCPAAAGKPQRRPWRGRPPGGRRRGSSCSASARERRRPASKRAAVVATRLRWPSGPRRATAPWRECALRAGGDGEKRHVGWARRSALPRPAGRRRTKSSRSLSRPARRPGRGPRGPLLLRITRSE